MTGLRDALATAETKAPYVRRLFHTIADRYDLITRLLSFGCDRRWKGRLAALAQPHAGTDALDLACGTGDLCRELSAAGYRPVGVDFSHGMLAAARTDAPLVEADVLRLPVRAGGAEGVTCGFALRNVVSLEAFFAEVARVVRPGGRVALLDVSEPDNAVLRAGNAVYFRRIVPVIGGLLSDADAYRYLPRSTAYLPPPAEMLRMLRQGGFPDAVRHQLAGGLTQLLVGSRA
jgi:demethylmenaquinone methyltransferase/2-methoxy-6-polyprenyl-1,4-benzoquinol methylase